MKWCSRPSSWLTGNLTLAGTMVPPVFSRATEVSPDTVLRCSVDDLLKRAPEIQAEYTLEMVLRSVDSFTFITIR